MTVRHSATRCRAQYTLLLFGVAALRHAAVPPQSLLGRRDAASLTFMRPGRGMWYCRACLDVIIVAREGQSSAILQYLQEVMRCKIARIVMQTIPDDGWVIDNM